MAWKISLIMVVCFFFVLTHQIDLSNLFRCKKCSFSKLNVRSGSSYYYDLYIVDRDCISENNFSFKVHIGNTKGYMIVFSNFETISKCKTVMRYDPKLKVNPELFSLPSSKLVISYVNVVFNSSQSKDKIISELIYSNQKRFVNYKINEDYENQEDYFDSLVLDDFHLSLFSNYLPKGNSPIQLLSIECIVRSILCLKIISSIPFIISIDPYHQNKIMSYPDEYRQLYDSYGISALSIQSNSKVPVIWNHDLHGENLTIGCADSGIDPNSCFFRDENEIGPEHRKITRYNPFFQFDDVTGHGTHVAGIFAGESFDELMKYNGISFSSKISLDGISNGDVIFLPNDFSSSILQPNYDIGVRIHTNSWGKKANHYLPEVYNLDSYLYEHNDLLVVFPSGNNGSDGLESLSMWAHCKNCLSVGASTNYNHLSGLPEEDQLQYVAYYSSRGPSFDGRIKPEIVAIGTSLTSAAFKLGEYSCQTANKSGTSMSAPLIAGAVNLIYQYLVEGYYPLGYPVIANRILSPPSSLLKAMIIHSGVPMKGYTYKTSNVYIQDKNFPNNYQGFGRAVLDRVLIFADNKEGMNLFIKTNTMTNEKNHHIYEFIITDLSHDFKATLVWTDIPAVMSSNKLLVQDLDLRIYSDHYCHFSNNGRTIDTINNVEVVFMTQSDEISRVMVVSVHSEGLVEDNQDYSLVVTGSFIFNDIIYSSLPQLDLNSSRILFPPKTITTVTNTTSSYTENTPKSDQDPPIISTDPSDRQTVISTDDEDNIQINHKTTTLLTVIVITLGIILSLIVFLITFFCVRYYCKYRSIDSGRKYMRPNNETVVIDESTNRNSPKTYKENGDTLKNNSV